MNTQLKAEIDAVLAKGYTVKQTFVTQRYGKTQVTLLTSTNALSSNPMIDVGSFDNHEQALAASHEAFLYAIRK